jgi:hypothetical protein
MLGANKLQLDTEAVTVHDSASNQHGPLVLVNRGSADRLVVRERLADRRAYLSACLLFKGITWPYCPTALMAARQR